MFCPQAVGDVVAGLPSEQSEQPRTEGAFQADLHAMHAILLYCVMISFNFIRYLKQVNI